MQLQVVVFRVLPGRHSDQVPLPGFLTAVLSEDCGACGHGEFIGGPVERTFFLRPYAVQESKGILHQTAMFGANDLQLLLMIKCASSNNQGPGQYLVEAF